MRRLERAAKWLASLALSIAVASMANAVDGVIEINQATVEASGGFPFVIDEPGSYRLTSDLATGASGAGGIRIAASDVSLDLNGFRIVGCPDAFCLGNTGPGTGAGIEVDDDELRVGVRVANGHVVGSANHGIWLGDQSAVRDVVVRSAGGSGIAVGAGSVVSHCISSANVGNGVYVHGRGGIVRDTAASDNQSFGIVVREGSVVSGSTVRGSGSSGIQGLEGSRIVGNVSMENQIYGIRCVDGCSIEGNTAQDNIHDGIYAGDASTVRGNVARGNTQHGLRINEGSLAQGNTSFENGQRGLYVIFGTAGFRENVLRDNGEGQVGASLNGAALDLGDNQCGHNGSCAGAVQP